MMKWCSKCKICKPSEDFLLDHRAKDGRQSQCRSCINAARKARRSSNIEKARANSREYYAKNSARVRANNAKYKASHRQAVLDGKRRWYEKVKHTEEFQIRSSAYRERIKETKRAYDAEYVRKNRDRLIARQLAWAKENPESSRKAKRAYKKRNPHKGAEYASRRRATRINATPKWLNTSQLDEMNSIYLMANSLGREYEVDHIVPLRGKMVCGLHVPWNLRIITAVENNFKGNRIIDHGEVARHTFNPSMFSK